jgi:hypothetical protein
MACVCVCVCICVCVCVACVDVSMDVHGIRLAWREQRSVCVSWRGGLLVANFLCGWDGGVYVCLFVCSVPCVVVLRVL